VVHPAYVVEKLLMAVWVDRVILPEGQAAYIEMHEMLKRMIIKQFFMEKYFVVAMISVVFSMFCRIVFPSQAATSEQYETCWQKSLSPLPGVHLVSTSLECMNFSPKGMNDNLVSDERKN
jgi:hypothetical protein